MRILVILLLLSLSGCREPKKIDLEKVASSTSEAFKYVNYRPGQMDYTYCERSTDIVDLIREENRVIVVCLAIDYVFLNSGEKSRFFKYSSINEYGQVSFCGWRDNHMKINRKGVVIGNQPKTGVSGKCDSFSISRYSHI
ncbi:hypothetical protein [Vibrio genomosp. F10]|uniref:hypothetical protein n=1 Tax=Vibrio genomosp. F10 TaxID=723171 RepID=UPI0003764E11|nr:hypothetical protein [Vibrio genomosp. F10]OEF08755.1 hypothetical protein A1QI_15840 [Vibrio genomosp. F10 str. 9ZB36]